MFIEVCDLSIHRLNSEHTACIVSFGKTAKRKWLHVELMRHMNMKNDNMRAQQTMKKFFKTKHTHTLTLIHTFPLRWLAITIIPAL